jgi:hypothetical protein
MPTNPIVDAVGCLSRGGEDIEAIGIPVAQIIRHEEAHCSGWPADHPGGIKTYATGS